MRVVAVRRCWGPPGVTVCRAPESLSGAFWIERLAPPSGVEPARRQALGHRQGPFFFFSAWAQTPYSLRCARRCV